MQNVLGMVNEKISNVLNTFKDLLIAYFQSKLQIHEMRSVSTLFQMSLKLSSPQHYQLTSPLRKVR